ncbi:AP-4 complex accessory subunit RUSC2 [Microcaecilia unicolor]|uniref:Iporin n=1 Tax=Microcaecilia unicolor TaxID=1415580 RepID=A0A6P7X883_9AMPH|nr:iporin [Microcaecilia unicolor]XP_030048674.1 iporin [Microcaecilia unicolor]
MSVMDSPPKLTGETLIVHHIPLVHCQVAERQCCGPSKRGNPFCQSDLSITRTTSLPERDLSQTDSLVYSSLIQPSTLPAEASDDADVKVGIFQGHVANKRHNPFLLNEREENDIYGESQMSFHLHNAMTVGKSAFHLHEVGLPPFHLHDTNNIVKPWSMANRPGIVEGQEARSPTNDIQKRNANRGHLVSEHMELDDCSFHLDGSSNFPMDCGDPEWNNSSDESLRNQEILRSRTCSCSSSEVQPCRCYSVSSQSETLDHQMGYISDSSCNSSDGVLVNFSTLYNKMNEHSRSNLNSANLSCDSSFCSHSDTGAFYLDLHSSPTESKMSCESHHPENSGKTCECHHPSSPVLDANCNSYHLHCESMPCPSDSSDLTACFQSQARLVVATQNYYKLVTCDLSSQSSPSPEGSSITSCSEDHTKTSPVQPTEYYLFQRPDAKEGEDDAECFREMSQGEDLEHRIEGQVYVNVSPPNLNTGRQRSRSYDRHLDRSPSARLGSLERMMSCPVKLSDSHTTATQDSVPKRVTSFAELAKSRKKNGFSPPLRASGDSSLEFSPIPEFQKGLFSRDGEYRSQSLPFMPVVPCLNRSSEGSSRSPDFRECQEVCSSKASAQGATQGFVSQVKDSGSSSDGNMQRDPRAKADGVGADGKQVVRYSRDQRPTTLPIQPFVFQHHFSKTAKPRPLHNHFTSSLSQLYGLSASRAPSQQNSDDSQSSASATSTGLCMEQIQAQRTLAKRSADGADGANKKPTPETTRLSPLGSYSPVKNNGTPFKAMDTSSGSPTPERPNESHPPRSRSCPLSANLLSTRPSPARGVTQPGAVQFSRQRPSEAPQESNSPKLVPKKDVTMEWKNHPSRLSLQPTSLPPLPPLELGTSRPVSQAETPRSINENPKAGPGNSVLSRPLNANHLSPQALKWREYRRKNPLGLEGVSGLAGLASSLDRKQLQEPRMTRRFFDFPSSLHGSHIQSRLNGPLVKHLHINHSDFFPDFFSLAEKPPAEFCLSPDGTSESVSVDLVQKKGLVKAVNTAVDLIVAHFGTSRDPGVKAKLGNSSVSPNVGHLILKYLCPAIRAILSDGLKAYVLDMIIGQRRNLPWSVAEASTQLGPSTKVLHNLYNKISQCPELTNHNMRFNAFIFGLLNIRSLEFWFNHLYNHEDIIWTHYQPVGFLSLSHSVCQALFEELLLLLQPLSLLPFDLDLLFEHHLLQMGREQQQKKEQLRVKQGLQLSVHSTLQLMRTRAGSEDSGGWSPTERVSQSPGVEKAAEERAKRVGAAAGESEKEEAKKVGEAKRDKQAGWWYQLMQSSQVYIEGSAEGPMFVRHEKKKKQGGAAAARPTEGRKAPLPREGVVEGAEACPVAEVPTGEGEPALSANKEGKKEPKEISRPSWMGSPPDSVLSELKQSKEQQAEPHKDKKAEAAPSENGQALKWGRLFGSRKLQSEARQTNRLPSNWLSLDTSVLQLMAQTVSGGIWREAAAEKELPEAVRCQGAPQ